MNLYGDDMCPPSIPPELFPGYENEKFRIDGGDGDQKLFGAPLVFQRVTAPWFNGDLGQLSGDAWLVRVVDGPRTGLLLGLTPRTTGNIADDIALQGWKSVIVHGLDYPGLDATTHGPRTIIGGMAFMERI